MEIWESGVMIFNNILTLIHEPGTVLFKVIDFSYWLLYIFYRAPKPGVRILTPSTVSCHPRSSPYLVVAAAKETLLHHLGR